MKITEALIRELNTTPFAILERLSLKEILALVKQANTAFHSNGLPGGKPLFSDDIYDLIKDYACRQMPDHALCQSDVGAAILKRERIKLPIWMGSQSKLKEEAAIERWRLKYAGPYVISDKLDGISCLFHQVRGEVRLYSRGDGEFGQDISHLLKHIKGLPELPKIQERPDDELLVRGELIIRRKDWDLPVFLERNNPRNTVAGLANSKKVNAATAALSAFVHFVAYEKIGAVMPSIGLADLKRRGFEVVEYLSRSSLNTDWLSQRLVERRESGIYEVDGLVVADDAAYPSILEGNPPFSFAFKSIITMEQAEVTVKEIVWNVSKNGLLKPVVMFDTVFIGGAHIHKATAHNAQTVKDHTLGPGARIVVIRSGDVIPYILKYLSPSASGEPQLPDQVTYPWLWRGVDLALKNPELAHEYGLKQLENYANVFNIKGLGAKLLKKLYDSGIDTIKKLANVTKIQLYKASYSTEITTKIYKQLQDVFKKGKCIEFMDASNVFGAGLGQSKLKLITDHLPGTLNPDAEYPTLESITSIRGIGERNARQFLEHLAAFHSFMAEGGLPCRREADTFEENPEGCMSVNGKNIAFTGFRSKELSEFVQRHGGKVLSSVSNNTHIVVAYSHDDDSQKMELARELNLTIMSKREFEDEIGFVMKPMDEEASDSAFDKERREADADEANADREEKEESDSALGISLNKTAECARQALNWSVIKRPHLFGKSAFLRSKVLDDLPKASPKLEALMKKIRSLDKKDMESHGHHFKHMIFSDVYKRGYGAKIIAAALASTGFDHAYNQDFEFVGVRHSSSLSSDSLNDSERSSSGFSGGANTKTKQKRDSQEDNRFAVLATTQLYTRPMPVEFKIKLLKRFNSRPDNIQGELIRIIVLDTGYKEGIDLFDVKYVHLFEPALFRADEMQAIGRAIRFCGQKGLPFKNKGEDKGWRVHIYKYEHVAPETMSQELVQRFGGKTSLEMILNQIKLDKNLSQLTLQLEHASQAAAADRILNRSIHGHSTMSLPDTPFQQKMVKLFGSAVWPPVKVENLCKTLTTGVPELSPSQLFVRNFFTPNSAQKGMLLWHSLGSGKTCSAIACASAAWEASGYSILWITRGTLRGDVYKNMFDMSCMERIKDYLAKGEELPDSLNARKRLINRKAWFPPISYKQFNNTLKKENRMFDSLVKKNGYADPFRKTLLIIDEAHLMMSSGLKEKDRPNVELLKAWIRNSFKLSKDDSVRVMLMTATPITDDPYNFAKLVNLTAETEGEELLEGEADFQRAYLDESLSFTSQGLQRFAMTVEGRISYLNRMRDIRQFAQPQVHSVLMPFTEPKDLQPLIDRLVNLEEESMEWRGVKMVDLKKGIAERLAFEFDLSSCDGLPPKEKRPCVATMKAEMKVLKAELEAEAKDEVAEAKEKLDAAKGEIKELRKEVRFEKKADISVQGQLEKRCFVRPAAHRRAPLVSS